MTPAILRDSPDAAESHAGKPREQWPEIILVGDAFAASTLGEAPQFHEAPALSNSVRPSTGQAARPDEDPE
jgi:hypothetical protein